MASHGLATILKYTAVLNSYGFKTTYILRHTAWAAPKKVQESLKSCAV